MRIALLFFCCLTARGADTMPPDAEQRIAREIYKEMVEVKSGFTTGTTTPISESVAARFKAAGFPASDIFVGGAIPTKANVVVRYHGTGARKPMLLLAHIDVVEAKREDWTVDPFVFLEKDGYFYGRGTADDKAQAAVWVATLLRFKREGYQPDRDLILALTADEEGGGPYNGVNWLLEKHRSLIDSEFAINEGARGMLVDGKRVEHDIGLAEKQFLNLRWEVRNKGGHSARPIRDNAIYHLAKALDRLANFDFDFHLTDITREYFRQAAKTSSGSLAADMARIADGDQQAMRRVAEASAPLNAMMRTTCVATQLEGGHATNALPQLAAANVNCRLLPDDSAERVVAELTKLTADQVKITITTNEGASPASPLRPDIMKAFSRITDTMWPGVVTVPTMAVGGSDGRYLRIAGIPTYGVQGFFQDRDDVRAHGRDERMLVRSFFEGQTFLYEFVKALSRYPPSLVFRQLAPVSGPRGSRNLRMNTVPTTTDRVVSIHPYFRVAEGKMDQFRNCCERFMSITAQEPRCLYYGFSFHADNVHCREAYDDAEALLAHLANVAAVLNEALTIAQLTRLEIHGIAEELAKLTGPLSNLAPTYFALEYGIRRQTSRRQTSRRQTSQ